MPYELDPIIPLVVIGGTLAKWEIITAPTFRPVTADDAREHIRSEGNESDAFYERMIDAATAYAEETMNVTLCASQIAATFDAGEPIVLPRGPVMSILDVAGRNQQPTTDYTYTRAGYALAITLGRAVNAYPLRVTYAAGYPTADAIPADIRLAILTHVGTLYEARESTSDAPRSPVPHSLDAFYARRNRNRGIG